MSLFGIGAGKVFSGLLGIGSSLFDRNSAKASMEQQFQYQKALQQQNIDWEKEQWQNKNQWTVQDMKNAGLNPILAAGNTGSVGSAPGGAVSIADTRADIAGKISTLQRNSAESKAVLENARANTRNADANQRNADSNSRSVDSLVKKNENEIKVSAANSAAQILSWQNQMKNNDLVSAAMANMYNAQGASALEQAAAATRNSFSNSARANAEISKFYKEVERLGQVMEYDTPKVYEAKQKGQLYRDAPGFTGFWNTVGHVTDNLFKFIRF